MSHSPARTFAPFFRPGEACVRYSAYRDGPHPYSVGVKRLIEELWQKAWRFVDPDLPTKAQRSFAAAFWELDLAATFLESGIALVERRSPDGPDVVCVGPPRIYVEAVSATPGESPETNPNSVHPLIPEGEQDGPARFVPHEQIILRLRNAIEEKYRTRREYLTNGMLQPTDPYVIAVSAAEIGMAGLEMTIPDILSAVLPFGDEFISVNLLTGEAEGGGFKHRPAVLKANRSPVSTTLFQQPEHDGISAILYSDADELNRRVALGACFTVIRNPRAANPVSENLFMFGRHFIVRDDGTVERRYLSPESPHFLDVLHAASK